jgi:dolichol kinase
VPSLTTSAPGIRRELARKSFHIASVVLPASAWVLPRATGIILLGTLLAAAVGIEIARRRVRGARYLFLRFTRPMLRAHERRGLAGATWMAIAYTAALIVFPMPVAVAAMLYNALGDSAAALVGRRYGRHRTAWGKSWEGFAAALAVGLAIGFLVPGLTPLAAVLGALAAATLELLPIPIDDNLRVTLGGGAFAWLGLLLS